MNFPRRGWLRRLRHGRGFGVHSPSAYRYIREVLRQPCAYYAYEAVDAMAASWPGGRRHARMLLRIAASARPASVAVGCDGYLSATAAAICRLACPSAPVAAQPGPDTGLIVMLGGVDAGAAFDRARSGATIVFPDRNAPEAAALLGRISSELPFGHCFRNGAGAAVFVGRKNVPAQSFDVSF